MLKGRHKQSGLFIRFSLCYFVLVFFSHFSIAITSHEEERANLSAFRTFVRFVLVWFCRFPFPLGVWEGLRFVIVELPFFDILVTVILSNICQKKSVCVGGGGGGRGRGEGGAREWLL